MAVRAVVQDRRRLYREGIAMVLAGEPDIEVVGTCVTAADVRAMCREHRPDVVILEADSGDWDVYRLAVALRRRHRSLRLIGLYRSLDGIRAHLAYRAGFEALVSVQTGLPVLLEALRRPGRLGRSIPLVPPTARFGPRDSGVTPRQLDVLRLVSLGSTTEEVARRLGISPKTVAHHKQGIYRRLGAHDQAHAVSIAARRGLLTATLALDAGEVG